MNNYEFEKQSFDSIAELYFRKNFGQASKQEVDMLMFHIFLEKMRKSDERITDYRISKELGITQQRARNLRIKEQLLYPREIDWRIELASLLENARYEEPNLVVDIPDPNILIEVKNYLEEKGKYVNLQLNSRLLSMRVEFFLELAVEIDQNSDKKKIYKELVKKIKKENKAENIQVEDIVSLKGLLDAGINITTIVANLSSILLPGNCMISAIGNLVR